MSLPDRSQFARPSLMQTSVSFERRLPRASNLTVTYINSHGRRQLLSRNVNPPLPGTFDTSDASSRVRPYPNSGNIYEFQSAGKFAQNQLAASFTTKGFS
jgi:hypothetical protein